MTGLWFLHSAIPLMALYQCIKKKLPSILLEICSGQKREGRTDRAATICSRFGEHKKLVQIALSEQPFCEVVSVAHLVKMTNAAMLGEVTALVRPFNLFDVYFTTMQLVLVPCGGSRTSPRTSHVYARGRKQCCTLHYCL